MMGRANKTGLREIRGLSEGLDMHLGWRSAYTVPQHEVWRNTTGSCKQKSSPNKTKEKVGQILMCPPVRKVSLGHACCNTQQFGNCQNFTSIGWKHLGDAQNMCPCHRMKTSEIRFLFLVSQTLKWHQMANEWNFCLNCLLKMSVWDQSQRL